MRAPRRHAGAPAPARRASRQGVPLPAGPLPGDRSGVPGACLLFSLDLPPQRPWQHGGSGAAPGRDRTAPRPSVLTHIPATCRSARSRCWSQRTPRPARPPWQSACVLPAGEAPPRHLSATGTAVRGGPHAPSNAETAHTHPHARVGHLARRRYAIAMAFRDKQRVVYTSPLKALSNQKFRCAATRGTLARQALAPREGRGGGARAPACALFTSLCLRRARRQAPRRGPLSDALNAGATALRVAMVCAARRGVRLGAPIIATW